MAYTELRSVSVNVKLEDGLDSDYNTKYVNVSLGQLDEDNYDLNKVIAVVYALVPCLSKTISQVEEVKKSYIYAG